MPTDTFSSPGWHIFNVPAGVDSVTIACNGAGSGASPAGRVTGKRAVNGNQLLRILIGEAGNAASGSNGGPSATGGGGSGGNGNNENGGAGGGGGSFVRLNDTDGPLICAAGGAGGRSADNGAGGEGGAATGESGSRGTSGSNSTGAATGGTQSQGGNGGTSSSGSGFNGNNASNSTAARGGTGGDPGGNYGHGGGGGGGGYKAGGGGQASSRGYAPGGGGGGGSNYTGGLTGAASARGAGGTGHGSVSITWTNPAPANQPPSPPTSAQVNGNPESSGMATKAKSQVVISAVIDDPDAGQSVRMLVRYSTSSSFASYKDQFTTWGAQGRRASETLSGLSQDTHYYVRLYTQDEKDKYSSTYNALDFWTNRGPNPPVLVLPVDNATIPSLSSVTFDWVHSDPDPGDPQNGFQLQWRVAPTITTPAGAWHVVDRPTETDTSWVVDPGTFKGNTFYEWQVRTKDPQDRWGSWSLINSFYSSGVSAPPVLNYPIQGRAVDATAQVTFQWRFVDPVPGDHQTRADLRYRPAGAGDDQWVTLLGAVEPGAPGENQFWTLPQYTFAYPGYQYEWQVRTYDSLAQVSDWSDSGNFWTIGTPGGQVTPDPGITEMQGVLGCGTYRVFIYDQGGQTQRGEITPISKLTFTRLRDDISNCVVDTNGFGDDCGDMLREVRSWLHEMVVYRDGERVWEGPITRITYTQDSVEFEAKDVMAYVYRRILRQGFNDSYRLLDATDGPGPEGGTQIGLPTVVWRASQIIINALAPSDPNVLPFLTVIQYADDAQESRIVPDYSTTAWEQVDDLAATAGLDYTTVGRRIILNDTHRSIGRLPEMRDGDFSDPPVVTEYGMQLSNYQAVTNNNGVWGAARPQGETVPYQAYGPIEILDSAYGENAGGADTVLTPTAKAALEAAMRSQAKRNISGRWPTPVVVRVPDNSTLNPDVNVGFGQLVPGVWIPLASSGTLRTVSQWQKLDSVGVVFENGVEQVQVVMSPAPNQGQDPDSDAAAAEGT